MSVANRWRVCAALVEAVGVDMWLAMAADAVGYLVVVEAAALAEAGRRSSSGVHEGLMKCEFW